MFSRRSIRARFIFQLIIASAALIFIFSSFLFVYIKQSIYEEKRVELLQFAQSVNSYQSLSTAQLSASDALLDVSLELVKSKPEHAGELVEWEKNGRIYLTMSHPFTLEPGTYIKVTKDISSTSHLLNKIFNSILILNAAGFALIILYAIILSKMLVTQIMTLNRRLANMNEHLMRPLKVEELPEEFAPLGETLNHLIMRIHNFVKYQKELFIGAAHELRTPLAVIKLKNQVTLIKERSPQEYIEAIRVTQASIDEMNKITADILNVGRQEGAQLDPPVHVDIIEVLKRKANDFALLAENEGKQLQMQFQPDAFNATLQVELLNQILQNFLQNALKFTPKGKGVRLQSHLDRCGLIIEVIDEGCGIDESVDLFAPFKRQGSKSGVGLGLFLAKSAADAMGATMTLKNRTDGHEGAVASLHLQSKLCCALPAR